MYHIITMVFQYRFKRLYLLLFFSLILFISILNFNHAQISGESFSKYYSKVEFLEENIIKISKDMALRNNYDRAILPGQIEFRIGSGTLDSSTNIILENIKVFDQFGRNITYTYREFEDYSSIVLDIFYPLLPGFEYEFSLIYELEFESRGIFFKSLEIPLKESSIPIEQGTFEVILPRNNYFTYLGDLDMFATINRNVGVWELEDNLPNSVEFEYSFIPIRTPWLRGSYTFWIIVNLLMFAFLVTQIRKEIKKAKNVEGD